MGYTESCSIANDFWDGRCGGAQQTDQAAQEISWAYSKGQMRVGFIKMTAHVLNFDALSRSCSVYVTWVCMCNVNLVFL